MLFRSLVTLGFASYSASESIKLNQHKKVFEDSAGRERIFHGFNVVYKPYPYIPSRSAFNPLYSLTDSDIDELREWGASVVRLGVFWEAVEMSAGEFDD